MELDSSGVARAPQAPRPRGTRGAEGARQGPPGRSSRRNPLARGPNKFLAGGRKSLLRHCWIVWIIIPKKNIYEFKYLGNYLNRVTFANNTVANDFVACQCHAYNWHAYNCHA